MIRFEKITNKMLRQVKGLDAGDEGKFVAANIISLAQAYLAIDNDTCIPMPFAIYNDDEMVGFIQMAFVREDQDDDLEEDIYEVWRFMLDKQFQGRGYGQEALNLAIEHIKTYPHGPAKKIYLSYVPGNEAGQHIYYKAGFRETGEKDGEEIVMAYEL